MVLLPTSMSETPWRRSVQVDREKAHSSSNAMLPSIAGSSTDASKMMLCGWFYTSPRSTCVPEERVSILNAGWVGCWLGMYRLVLGFRACGNARILQAK